MRAALPMLALATVASGCVTGPRDCPALDAIGGLRCQASLGDKLSQLELGRAYEYGRGVEQDYVRAAKLYRQAASPTSGTTYIYSPPVGKEKSGRVLPVRIGADRPGLADAKVRLAGFYLAGTGVKQNLGKAVALLRDAARAGSAEAEQRLRQLSSQ